MKYAMKAQYRPLAGCNLCRALAPPVEPLLENATDDQCMSA